MKIDYDKKGMTIKLDKVPRLLYINEEGVSCGQVYENGVRIKNLQQVDIHARTNEIKVNFLKYSIKYYDESLHETKIIGGEDPHALFTVKVSLKDTDAFQKLLDALKSIVSNELIPIDVRENIGNKIHEILKGD